MIHFLLTDSTRLKKSKWNIPEPVDGIEIAPNKLDVVFVPLLAFDGQGQRVGYGKGFYDRYLNKHVKNFKKILTVGVAFSFQKYHKLPKDKNDVKLDYILTEKGFYK